MTITIAPFTVNSGCGSAAPHIGHVKEGHTGANHPPITYWGIYLDDRYVSYTSSKELAEKTKQWIEKWLEYRV